MANGNDRNSTLQDLCAIKFGVIVTLEIEVLLCQI
jgi:hypothetical protein